MGLLVVFDTAFFNGAIFSTLFYNANNFNTF